MVDRNEMGLLRAIALDKADPSACLVYADWLEERGDTARAEFVRVQNELVAENATEAERLERRVRERDLLNEHRQAWLRAYGVALEEAEFARGVLDKARLRQWNRGAWLGPAALPRLATLTELDLSHLDLGDAEITAFAQAADFPGLRKLCLNHNRITNAGANALAGAAGLPALETLYLFENPVQEQGFAALEGSGHFHLTNLDRGRTEEGYCMSPGQAEMERRLFVRETLLPLVADYFRDYERLQSAMLCAAQFWADEADDAVHGVVILSELIEPTMQGINYQRDGYEGPDPNLPNTFIPSRYSDTSSSELSLWELGAEWDSNSAAIPLWAAFALENGSQEYGALDEVYAPVVMFHRHGGFHFLPIRRPHLDGIRPQWER